MSDQRHSFHSVMNIAVLASGLGFFIDAFDLFLFNVYRVPSLKELGLYGADLTAASERLLGLQMLGMMIGGVLSGVIGDKRGRVAVLFASIALYSLANIANAFVTDVQVYAVVRFLAGIGLAGELGAGITLVSETMSSERRGYGTILVASLGAAGAVSAGLVADIVPWRTAFAAAGVAGLGELLLRVKSLESGMFRHALQSASSRGSFKTVFSSGERAARYIACILLGVPIWYSVGLLITFTPEITAAYGNSGTVLSTCFVLFQVGITLGDLSSGLLSQRLRSRSKALVLYMSFALVATIIHFAFIAGGRNLHLSSLLIGCGCGYLSVFVTTTAELFGTNIRVLVTSTVTNFMRGAVTVLIPLRIWIQQWLGTSLVESLAITGALVWVAAFAAVFYLPDPFGKDLDYVEQ
ncbi:MAG: MFS transporter [Candidatus Kapaibacterium sp.]